MLPSLLKAISAGAIEIPMRFSVFLSVFAVTVLLTMAFLPSLFGAALPLLEIMAAVILLTFLGSRERFWFAVLAGLIADILYTPAVFSYMPVFLLVAILFWLWDALVKLEEPILTISRLVLGFLVWPVIWALVTSFPPSEFQAAAMGSFFNVSQVLLGRDIVFELVAVGVIAIWRFHVFRRERLQNLTTL